VHGRDLAFGGPAQVEEELSLFAFDAQRRSFSGLILYVASTPGVAPPNGPKSASQANKPSQIGDFVFDFSNHRLWIRGVEVRLTPKEFKLLAFLSRHTRE